MSYGVEIHASRLVVGDGRVYEDCRIGIRGGVIREVSQESLKKTYEVVHDFKGNTIMPGLIDTHVHLRYGPKKDAEDLPDDYQAIRAIGNMRKALASGATTLIDAGGIRNMTFSLRKAQVDGLIEGPRLFVCGEMITITGGRSSKPGVRLYEVDGTDSARNAARRLLMYHNADFIKLGATGAISASHTGPRHPHLTLEEMTTICEEAHSCGRMVHAHCYGKEGIQRAIASGVDVIVHGQTLNDEDIDAMLVGGKMLIPTLKPYVEAVEGNGDSESRTRLLETEIWKETEPNFRKALAAGVKIALGTDSGMPKVYFGEHSTELEYMVRWGMTTEQAIAAGTINAAHTIGMGDRLGTLEPGKAADILVLGSDPLKDISSLRKNLEAVMLDGHFIKNSKN